jgi:hypothetical protein
MEILLGNQLCLLGRNMGLTMCIRVRGQDRLSQRDGELE